ncbi:MAG: hypothetical protein M3130_01090 [Actinomycetota bacterium]|nr:hypothetical protein [Actinomycetota bacterium]
MDDVDGVPIEAGHAATLGRLLSDFGPRDDQTGTFHVCPVNDQLPLLQPARLALLRAGFAQRWGGDKTAWELEGTFRGVDVVLADTLYGPRLRVTDRFDGDTTAFALDATASIAKAGKFVEKHVLAPHVAAQTQAGNLTLLNVAARLHGGYQYFRWQAQGLTDGHGNTKVRKQLIEYAKQAAGVDFFGPWFLSSNIRFCITAMTTAWFSWLEHVLVLMLPFGSWAPTDIPVPKVIGETWAEKWRRVVGIDTPEAKAVYDSLSQTAEQFRNSDTHGGFGKGDTAILVHVPGGPMPARLSPGFDHILTAALPPAHTGLTEVVAAFGAAETFLRSGETRFAMRWIDGGLDVTFDARTRADIHTAMTSGDVAFEAALDRWPKPRTGPTTTSCDRLPQGSLDPDQDDGPRVDHWIGGSFPSRRERWHPCTLFGRGVTRAAGLKFRQPTYSRPLTLLRRPPRWAARRTIDTCSPSGRAVTSPIGGHHAESHCP